MHEILKLFSKFLVRSFMCHSRFEIGMIQFYKIRFNGLRFMSGPYSQVKKNLSPICALSLAAGIITISACGIQILPNYRSVIKTVDIRRH